MKKIIIILIFLILIVGAIVYFVIKRNENKELTASDYIEQAEKLLAEEYYSKALEQYKLAINADPSNTETYLSAASLYVLKSNDDEAIELLNNGEKNASQPDRLHEMIGRIYFEKNDLENAVLYLEKSNSENKNNTGSAILLVKTYSYFQETDEKAIEVLNNLTGDESKGEKNYYLALYHYNEVDKMLDYLTGDFEDEDEEIKKLISDLLVVVKRFKSEPEDVIQNNTFLAYEMIKAELYSKAIAILDGLIEENDEYYATYLYRGVCYLSTDSLDKAKDDLKKATEIDPEQLQPWLFLAQVLTKQNNQKEADEAYQQALTLDKDNEEIRLDYARSLDKFGLYTQARNEYSELVDLESENKMLYEIELAYLSLDYLDELEEGLSIAKELHDNVVQNKISESELEAEVMDLLGWAYFKNTQNDEALKYMKQSIDTYPYSAKAHYHFGYLNKEINNLVDAKESLERAIDLDISGDISSMASLEIEKLSDE